MAKTKIEIRDLRNGNWYWIHKIVLEKYAKKIKANGIAVYNALCYFSDSNNQICFPSYQTIAQYAGCSEATVKRFILILERNKLIKRIKRSRYYYIYIILKIGQRDLSEDKIGQRDLPDRSERPINNNYITKINKKGDKKSPQQEIFSFFSLQVKKLVNSRIIPEINFAKDGKLLKNKLARFTPTQIKKLILWYLESKECEKFGPSLSICLSANIINKWQADTF